VDGEARSARRFTEAGTGEKGEDMTVATARLCANPACARPLTAHWRTCSRSCNLAAIKQRVFRCIVPGCVMPIGKNNVTCSIKCRRRAEMEGLVEISQDNVTRRRSSSAPVLPASCQPSKAMPKSDADLVTRRTDCAMYRTCLNFVEHQGWQGFECGGCTGYKREVVKVGYPARFASVFGDGGERGE
jgi:hypothetical protein